MGSSSVLPAPQPANHSQPGGVNGTAWPHSPSVPSPTEPSPTGSLLDVLQGEMDELRSRSASSSAERRRQSGLAGSSQRSFLSLDAMPAAGAAQDPSMALGLPLETRLAAVSLNDRASAVDHAASDPFAASAHRDLHIARPSHDDMATSDGLFSNSRHEHANSALDDPRGTSSAAIPMAGTSDKLGSPDSQDAWRGLLPSSPTDSLGIPMHPAAQPSLLDDGLLAWERPAASSAGGVDAFAASSSHPAHFDGFLTAAADLHTPNSMQPPPNPFETSAGKGAGVSALSLGLRDSSPVHRHHLSLPPSVLSTRAVASARSSPGDCSLSGLPDAGASEASSDYVDVSGEALMAGDPDQPLPLLPRTRTTADKFQAGEGDDPELAQMLWVVENLQEELQHAQEARLAVEAVQQQHRQRIAQLQAQLGDLYAQVAAGDDELDVLQQRLESALHTKAAHEEDSHQASLSLKDVQAQIAQTDVLLAERDARMDDVKKRLAEAQEAAAATARSNKPAAADHAQDGTPSPRSETSSTWGTGSDDDDGPASPRRTPSSIGESNQAKMAAAALSGGSWFRSMLSRGSGKAEVAAESALASASSGGNESATSSYAKHVMDSP